VCVLCSLLSESLLKEARQELGLAEHEEDAVRVLTTPITEAFLIYSKIHTGQFMEVGLSPTSSGASHLRGLNSDGEALYVLRLAFCQTSSKRTVFH
jgi:hypothetical protein